MNEIRGKNAGPLRLFIVAGEESGDRLGAALIDALRRKNPAGLHVEGVGGRAMAAAGLKSLFDIEEIAVMGFSAVISRLPRILKRIRQTARAAIAAKPDVLVIVDSPDFTHRVARKVRAALPDVAIVDYVCPSVWAWRPARAGKMLGYIDHVLAILPFEPLLLEELGGPQATYVGHPLAGTATPSLSMNVPAGGGKRLLMLPGSRRGEVMRLLPVFAETARHLAERNDGIGIVIPAVPHLKSFIEEGVRGWAISPIIVSGEDEKKVAFAGADAALAASGTVCLELALADVPMVAVYKLDPIARQLRFLVTTWTANLPNLIADYPAVPEYIDEFARPLLLARALERLLSDTDQRRGQLAAFRIVREAMRPRNGAKAEEKAASIVMAVLERKNRLKTDRAQG